MAQQTQKWVLKMATLLSSEVALGEVRQLIREMPVGMGIPVWRELTEMIGIAVGCQPASIVSDLVYYLCRKCQGFRMEIVPLLVGIYGNLCKNGNKNGAHWCKQAIILTNMFIFGIYFTQTEFINGVLASVLETDNNCMEKNR